MGMFVFVSLTLSPSALRATLPVGSNNDIGGFHENLVTFRDPELPSFQWAQKMRLKKCTS